MGLPTDILKIKEPGNVKFTGTQGDTFFKQYTAKDNSGNVIDISGCAIDFTITTARKPSNGSEDINGTGEFVTDGTDGKFKLTAPASDLAAATAASSGTRIGYHRVRFSAGGEIRTTHRGEFHMLPDLDS